AHANLGLLAARQGQFAEALGHIDRALSLNPPAAVRADLLAERGRVLCVDRRFPEALRAVEAALAADPKCAAALMVRGQALLDLGDPAGAEKALTAYLAQGGPAATNAYRLRGRAHVRRKNYTAAVADYSRV